MVRPNLFQYAKKELSQDAMICWLLACLHSEDAEYKKIGLDFIRLIFEDEFLREEDVELEQDSPRNQYFHMDVYAIVRIKDKLYPLIFENKTNTYLHDDQLERYCIMVSKWRDAEYLKEIVDTMSVQTLSWGDVKYVFFKTGYLSKWQESDLKKRVIDLSKKGIKVSLKNITIQEFIDVFCKHFEDAMLEDYCAVLEKQKERFDYTLTNGLVDIKHCNECLNDEKGSNEMMANMLFDACFGNNIKMDYNYQQWATINLFTTHADKDETEQICYGFRFDRRTLPNKRKEKAYAFMFYQYRNEKNVKASTIDWHNKLDEAIEIKKICNYIIADIFSKLEVTHPIKKAIQLDVDTCSKKTYNDKKLWGVYLYDNEITLKEICDFVREFSQIICKRIQEQPDFAPIEVNQELIEKLAKETNDEKM